VAVTRPARVAEASTSAARALLLAVLFATAGATISGCDDDASTADDHRKVHLEGDGPLSGSLPYAGGRGLSAPQRQPWKGTFGSVLLCSTTGDTVVLDRVRYAEKVSPLAVEPVIRDVPPGGDALNRAPVGGRIGTPAHFASRPHRIAGEFSREVSGTEILSCSQPSDESFTELLTVVTADATGAWLSEIDIDYHVGNNDYTLRIPYSYVACGTDVRKEGC